MKRFFVRISTEISGQEQGTCILLSVGADSTIQKEVKKTLKTWYDDKPVKNENRYTFTVDMYTEVDVWCDRYEEITEEEYIILVKYIHEL